MLPKTNRFQVRAEKDFFKSCYKTKLGLMYYYFRPSDDKIKIAIRVKKDSARTAVKRHALKRKITAIFEEKLQTHLLSGQLLVVTCQKYSEPMWPEIQKDIEKLIFKISGN